MTNLKFQQQLEKTRALTRALHSLDIDLSDAATDRQYSLAGNLFYVLHAPDNEIYINIKINDQNNPAHKLVKGLGFLVAHEALYITTPAGQAGTMTILHGFSDPDLFSVIDNRPGLVDDLASIRDELRGDTTFEGYDAVVVPQTTSGIVWGENATRKAISIQALSTNTDVIFLGFDSDLTIGGSGKWAFELQPGQAVTIDDYRGDFYAVSASSGQIIGIGEW